MSENIQPRQNVKGRGSSLPLANRFEQVRLEIDLADLDVEDQQAALNRKVPTEFYVDDSQSVVSQNESPDIDFRYSVNPYRGCSHGCSYCYARPSHEYLGLSAGLDFESKILVKQDAPKLLRRWLMRPSWHSGPAAKIEPIMLSGVTDPYQPCERKFELTRRCIEVCLEMRQPLRLITKNGLIRRDLDLLTEMAKLNLIYVTISMTTLDQSLVKIMEPRTGSPASKLDAISKLSEANVPVCVLTAPIIPGLNDQEIPELLRRVAEAGARSAGFTVLRLPLSVEPVFIDWLEQYFPDRKEKILDRVREMRGGKLYNSDFASRMKGTGIWAEQIAQMHRTFMAKYGLTRIRPDLLRRDLFCKTDADGKRQGELF